MKNIKMINKLNIFKNHEYFTLQLMKLRIFLDYLKFEIKKCIENSHFLFDALIK